jgi:hypothetical protein
MKRTLSLLISLIFSSLGLMAQDLIVTNTGDSLNCKITRRYDGYVYFSYLKDNEAKATLIPIGNITSMVRGYYGGPAIANNILASHEADYVKWPFRFYAGYSYRVAKVVEQMSPDYEDYLKKLKSGFVIAADLHGFSSEILGFGVKYNLNKYLGNEGSDISDNITMHYIAASTLNRFVLASSKNHFLLGANLGYQSFHSRSKFNVFDFDAKGSTVGVGLEAGFQHKMNDQTSLNLNLSLYGASLNSIKINKGNKQKLNKDERESLSRMELTVGLTFGK